MSFLNTKNKSFSVKAVLSASNIPLFVTFFVGCFLSVAMFFAVYEYYEAKNTKEFNERITEYAKFFGQGIERNLEVIHSAGDLFSASEDVQKKVFHAFIASGIKRYTGIKFIAWVSLKKDTGQNNYSDCSENYENTIFIEPSDCGRKIDVSKLFSFFKPEKNEHDIEKNITVAKYNMFGKDSVAVLLPVYRKNREFIGVILGVLNTNEVIENILHQYKKPAGLDIFIIDKTEKPFLFYYHPSRLRTDRDTVFTDISDIMDTGTYFKVSQKIADRSWEIIFKPVNESLDNDELLIAWFVLAAMLFITLFSVQYLYSSQNRMKLVENKVKERTTALHESEKRYRAVVETSPYAIIVHESGCLLFANTKAAELFGVEIPENLLEKRLKDILVTHTPEEMESFTESDGKTRNLKISCKSKDKELEIVSVPLEHDGRTTILSVINDITERKQLEAQLIQTTKLATIGETAAGIVHEISQPLNIIRMNADSALLGKNSDEKESFDIISRQAARMGEIINHMRIFSRKDTEKSRPFNPFVAVKSVTGFLGKQIENEGIKLNISCEENEVYTTGKTVQFEQVILNLLANAKDSIMEKQKISDKGFNGRISIEAFSVDDIAIIKIADNGTGIDDKSIKHIFDPFFTTKEPEKGTGLGLSVSHGIISSMAGSISVANDKDETVFTISVPCFKEKNEEKESFSDDTADTDDSIKILLADDEQDAVKVLKDFLVLKGYSVTVAFDGKQAFDSFLKEAPDIVITDIRMPETNGIELIDMIHKHNPDQLIIVVTGCMEKDIEQNLSVKKDNIAVIYKPVDIDVLEKTINEMILQEVE